MYAEIAINAPVHKSFEYHIPDALQGKIQPGHLVQVPFATAMQHGVVLSLRETSEIVATKPIIARLDPRPMLTEAQIDFARWLSRTYLAPIGACVWLLLPPGITGGRDIEVTLLKPDAQSADALEAEIMALLRKRGTLRGKRFNTALPGKSWRGALDGLAKAGIVEVERVLLPSRIKPKTIQTASLAIHPDEIDQYLPYLERPSKRAEVLENVLQSGDPVLRTAANKPQVDRLAKAGLVTVGDDNTISLAVSPDEAAETLREFRKLDKPLRILSLLAREGQPIEVNWIYAQLDVTLPDLKRLAEEGLVILGEQATWRDSLAERDFVPTTAPTLTPEQRAAWAAVEAAIEAQARVGSVSKTPPPTPPLNPLPVNGEGKQSQGAHDSKRQFNVEDEQNLWRTSPRLWQQLKPLAREKRHETTPAEAQLWQHLRRNQASDFVFRRQHTIGQFIVDFYCKEAALVIEVDGGIHQYTQQEDAIRQEFLEALGLRVVRFTNDQVFHALDEVLNEIATILEARRKAAPLSVYGEGSGEGFTATPSAFLLHGVTGSGKTEIYLRAIAKTLELGRSAILLVPEIALTPQTVRRVASRFGKDVAIIHSGLSDGERYDTWRRAREGLVRVIVGARSALFAPLKDVGLIVLDEEHDSSYKQGDSQNSLPRYHARHVAEEMMRRRNGVLILGSATPDLETSYRARRGELTLLHMPNRIMGHRTRIHEQAEREGVIARYEQDEAEDALTIGMPPVQVVDMRDELRAGNTTIFSRRLQLALRETLERKEQVILYLNRRGQSTYVFCRDCGYVATCPRCDTPLTHHRQGQSLRCHHCGYETAEPRVCPQCRSARIKFFGAGTQQVEQALHQMFPTARTLRWDADTADSPEAHESILHRFTERKADILVGTQMVAKGLDLPLVTLVGVVSADLGLALPDFRATERTFQLLTQVAGRAGRGLLGGQVVLQTYQPQHYVVAAASRHDYEDFYEREIAYRRDMGYPPFRRFVRIVFRFPSEDRARAEAKRAADILKQRIKAHQLTGTELIGPAPCFFTRVNKVYRWHLLLRGPDPTVALEGLDFGRGWAVDVDPVDVL